MTEDQKAALKALYEIECKIADAEGEDACDGPWCEAREAVKKAFKESGDE